jgi:phosphate-selective porin OprO/OprP
MQKDLHLAGFGLALAAGQAGLAQAQTDAVGSGVPAAPSASALQEAPVNTNYKAYWRDGTRFETGDLQFTMKLGGRINLDWNFLSGDDELEAGEDLEDKVDLRRLHLNLGGTLYESIEYFTQFDFAPAVSPVVDGLTGRESTLLVKDAWISLPGLGVGTLTIGQQFEPFGLETQTPQNHNTFLERSLADSLTPRRGTGIKYSGQTSDRAFNWAAGVFNSNTANAPDPEIAPNESWGGTGRVSYAFFDLGGKAENLVHLGAAYSGRSVQEGLRFQTRPEAFTETPWIDTETALVDADKLALLGLEAATALGPFSLQGEFMQADVDSVSTSNPRLDGFYIQASYFLTGESRPYKQGLFDRVRPKSNFKGFGNGIGAWEVALRYSEADYEEAVVGQELRNTSVGINWYLNPSVRFQTNYILVESEEYTDGSGRILSLRWEVAF